MIRKAIFWLHLLCGVAAGVVVLMMSLTGVILTYERQILAWEDQAYFADSDGRTRLPIETLIEQASQANFMPESVTVAADPSAPVVLRQGRSQERIVNPYSGEVHPPHSDAVDTFFSTVTAWHRWFNVTGEGRANARAVTGIANLMFLFLIVSGLYLWLPAVLRWSTMRLRLWFHPNAQSGQARDFNWHHVFGFWSAIPLAVVVATATVFNYSWANTLVYRLAGEEPPQRGGSAQQEQPVPAPANATALPFVDIIERAEQYSQQWRTMTITLPEQGSAALAISIDEGNGGQPQKRHALTLNAYTGEEIAWLPFSQLSAGRQARSWVRFLHTGEALGILGQTIAGLVSFASILMVWTGFALAWRRFLKWNRRMRKVRNVPTAVTEAN